MIVLAANRYVGLSPVFASESGNEWNVTYANSVVDIISAPSGDPDGAVGAAHSTAMVERCCRVCSAPFMARRRAVAIGRGVVCSPACRSRLRHLLHSQRGANNPNWRGGRASRPYASYVRHFKAANPEKVQAHQAVADAIRSGRLVRPAACSSCGIACHPDAHHADYSAPMGVEWLCRRCHRRADAVRSSRLHTGSVQEGRP